MREDFAMYQEVGFHPRLAMGCRVILHGRMTANAFVQYHNESVLKKYQERLKVGTLKESAKL